MTLVIIDCLFRSYFASHFRLVFYVLCKDIQPNHFRFILLYVLKDFFPSPPPSNYLPWYVKDIVQHMASFTLSQILLEREIVWPWCFKPYWFWNNIMFGVAFCLQFMLFLEFVVRFCLVLFCVFLWILFNFYCCSIKLF